MNSINNTTNKTEDIKVYSRISDYGVDLYQKIKLKQLNLTDKEILRLIVLELKILCKKYGYSYLDYQDYAIKEKINFGLLAQKKLKGIIIGLSSVISSSVTKILNKSYSGDNYQELYNVSEEVIKVRNIQHIEKIKVNKLRQIFKDSKKIKNEKLGEVKSGLKKTY